MNKKISTLMMAGLLGASPLCGSAWAQGVTTPVPVPAKINGISLINADEPAVGKPWPKGPYFVIADVDGSKSATVGDVLFRVLKENETLTYDGVTIPDNPDGWDLNDISWNFIEETVKDGVTGKVSTYLYSLQNVGTGTYLKASTIDGEIITVAKDATIDAKDGQSAKFATGVDDASLQFKQRNILYLSTTSTTTLPYGLTIDPTTITGVNGGTNASNVNLILCKLDTKTMDADDVAKLNDIKGGAGFNLEFDGDGVVAGDSWSESEILSDLNLKAFWVDGFTSLDEDANKNIPQGVYFAVVDENLPASLLGKDEIETVEEFMACTFVAIDPIANNAIHEAKPDSEQGYELTMVKASEMNFFTGASTPADDLSAGDEVYVGNACFTLEVPDAIAAPGKFNIKVADYRALKTEKDNPTKKHDAMTGYIGVVNDQHVNYLVTTSTATLTFEATNTTIMDGDALVETFLQKENAASIYTIQFVSGEDKEGYSEYEQYLTNMGNSSGFEWASTVNYNEADPAYQFVVTAIDKTNKTITFNNRLTKEPLTVQLYENKDKEKFNIFDMKFSLGPLEKVFGPGGVQLKTQGSVQVQAKGRDGAVTLSPGEIAIYDRQTGRLARKTFIPEYYMSVEEQNGCQFVNMRFTDIAASLERRFGVKIFIADDRIAQQRFYASFINGEGVDEILAILNMEARFRISRSGNTILIE